VKLLQCALIAAIGVLSACTPNGVPVSGGSSGGGGQTFSVDVNLTLNAPVSTPYGPSGGMKPPVLTVKVGDSIVFHNSDGFAHTASLVSASAPQFPADDGLTTGALTPKGNIISTARWTSGAMQAGSSSQSILVDKPGTYLYGCFFHYGAPMRGAIVAQ
jgi:plastocyanin